MLPTDITLEESLELIGFRPGDRIAICHSAPDVKDDWHQLVIDVADMPAENARRFCQQVNTWHSVNVPGAPIGSRQRGAESTVARINAVFSDLDLKTELKPGGITDLATAEQIINEVSARVGHTPTVVVSSGHGLQPYWPLEPDDADELPIGDGMALSRAFGALVAIVANEIQPGVTVDNVADLSRVGRSANSINYKEPHHPVPTFATAWGGAPIGVQELKDRLEDIGIDWKDYRNPPTGEVISPPEHWVWNECAHCTYTPVMITGWQKDKPGQRHQWMLSQKVRIEAARRHGCFPDQESYLAAHAALDKRFAELRTPRRYECASAQRWAMDRVSRKADGEILRELGDHIHNDEMIGGGEDVPTIKDEATGSEEEVPTTKSEVPKRKQRKLFGPKGGLLTQNLALAVADQVLCGFNDLTEKFYTYSDGVWTANGSALNAAMTKLLGNQYRTGHKSNGLDMIRHLDSTVRINGEPSDPRYINTPGGMVDWKTGDLVAHSPDFRSTVQLPVRFNPDAKCPAFEKFIGQVLPDDCVQPTKDSPGFIWELIGYTMYSGNPLHIAVLLHGIGRNGKGTLIRVLKALLGEHNTSSVGLHDLTDNRFRAASLYGKLANLAGDLDSKWIDNTAAFKAITGGDTIQAEHKYGQPFDFTPWALPIYSANKPFGSADSSEGWHARWVVVPFPNTFLDAPDRGLDAKLCADNELEGIMARGVAALPTLMARGVLPEPAKAAEAKRAFVAASDSVRAWIDENCVIESGAWSDRTKLYADYRNQTFTDGSKQLSAREFYSRVEQIGGITRRKNVVAGFAGIRLVGQR